MLGDFSKDDVSREEVLNAFLRETFGDDTDFNVSSGYGEYSFDTDEGDFLVLDDIEADRVAKERLLDFLETEGISGIRFEYLGGLEEYVDTDWFDEAKEESNRFYCEDIASEDSSEFENRLVEECYESNIISDDDFEDGECTVSNDDLIDMYTEYLGERDTDSVRWFINNYGEEEFNRVVIERSLVNLDTLADDILSTDGRAMQLAGYDFNEIEFKYNGKTYFLYREN